MRYFTFLTVLFLLNSPLSYAQDCYPVFLKEGTRAFKALDFERAINQFNAAKICDDLPADNKIEEWINKAQNGYIDAIKKERVRAQSLTLTTKSILELENNDDATKAFRYAQYALELDDNPESRAAFYKSFYQLESSDRKNFYIRDVDIFEEGDEDHYIQTAHFIDDSKSIILKDESNDFRLFNLEGEKIGDGLRGVEGNWNQFYSEVTRTLLSISKKEDGLLYGHLFKDGVMSEKPVFEYQKDSSEITGLAISMDGERIAVCFDYEEIQILDEKGKYLYTVDGEEESDLEYFAFAETNDLTLIYENRIKVVNTSAENYQVILDNKDFKLYQFNEAITIAPNGKYLIMQSSYETIIMTISGDTIALLDDLEYEEEVGTFSSNSKYVTFGDQILNLEDEYDKQEFPSKTIQLMTASSDGKFVVGFDADKEGRAWKFGYYDYDYDKHGTLGGHRDKIIQFAFSPDDSHLISVSEDQTFKIWDLNMRGHTSMVGEAGGLKSIAINKDQFFFESYAGLNTLWKIGGNEPELLTLPMEHVRAVADDGKYLITDSEEGIEVFELSNIRTKGFNLKFKKAGYSILNTPAFSNDGRIVYHCKKEGTDLLEILDLKSGETYPLKGLDDEIMTLKWSADNKRIAADTYEGIFFVWYLEQGLDNIKLEAKLELEIELEEGNFHFSPDGHELMMCDEQNVFSVDILAPEKGLRYYFDDLKTSILKASYSPDGQFILLACNDQSARIYTRDEELVTVLEGVQYAIDEAIFSEDGRYIITNSKDHDLKIWPFDTQLISEYLESFGIPDLSEEEKEKYGIKAPLRQKNMQVNNESDN